MLAFLQPGWDFRQHRKNLAKIGGSTTSVAVFDRVQNEEAAHFLLNVLESPNDLWDHIRKEAGAVILRITYGYTPNAKGPDPLVDMAEKTMSQFSIAGVPGQWLVDVFPFRKSSQPCLANRRTLSSMKCASCRIGAQVPNSKLRLANSERTSTAAPRHRTPG